MHPTYPTLPGPYPTLTPPRGPSRGRHQPRTGSPTSPSGTLRPMPAYPEPSVRQKANGAWFVHWGGKEHYLSMDSVIAHKMWADPTSTHPGARSAWLRWRAARLHAVSSTRAAPVALSVVQAAERFLAAYEAAGRPTTAAYFRGHLARFLHAHGGADLVTLTTPAPDRHQFQPPIVPLLEAFKTDLASPMRGVGRGGRGGQGGARTLEPRTINHDLTAIKRLFNWAAEQGHCPEVRWRGVKKLPVRRAHPEDLPIPELVQRMAQLRQADEHLWRYCLLNYYTLARPSEVVRLIMDAAAIRAQHFIGPPAPAPPGRHRRRPAPDHATDPRNRGRFLPIVDERGRTLHPSGLFELALHKSTWREGSGGEGGKDSNAPARFLVLTDPALELLAHAVPIWSTLDGYSSACARVLPGFGPRMLRDSAASHLRARGVALADVQILLGHAPRGEWPSYARTPWPRLRAAAARLVL